MKLAARAQARSSVWSQGGSPVTHLRKVMLEELHRRNYSANDTHLHWRCRAICTLLRQAARSTWSRTHSPVPGVSTARAKVSGRYRCDASGWPAIFLRAHAEAPLSARHDSIPQVHQAQYAKGVEPGGSSPTHRSGRESASTRHAHAAVLHWYPAARTDPASRRGYRQRTHDDSYP